MKLNKISLPEILVLVLVFLMVLIGFAVYAWNRDFWFEHYTIEDGVTEWLTVLALLLCCFLLLSRALRLRNNRSWYFVVANIFLAVLFFMAAGEEISWGQRIFGIQSSEYFQQNNAQGETNLHNLVIGGVRINQIFFSFVLIGVLVIYFLLFPFLYRRSEAMRLFVNRWGIPVPRLYQVIAFFVLFGLTELIPNGKRAELLECGAVFLFFLVFAYPANRAVFDMAELPQTKARI